LSRPKPGNKPLGVLAPGKKYSRTGSVIPDVRIGRVAHRSGELANRVGPYSNGAINRGGIGAAGAVPTRQVKRGRMAPERWSRGPALLGPKGQGPSESADHYRARSWNYLGSKRRWSGGLG
jgi:hypothetical protein